MDNTENTEVAEATRNAFPHRAEAPFPLVIRSYQAIHLFLVLTDKRLCANRFAVLEGIRSSSN
jgi:hypothetical protein